MDSKLLLANIIKSYRVQKNVYQKEMAKLIGCSHANLCKIEAGQIEPKSEVVLNILKLCLPNFENMLYLADIEADEVIKSQDKTKNYHKRVKVSNNIPIRYYKVRLKNENIK